MTDLSKSIKFRNELRLRLKGSFSDLILKSGALKNVEGISHIVRTCEDKKIDPLDIRSTDANLIGDIGFVEGVSLDALGRRYDNILNKILNKIITTLLSAVEEPSIQSLAKIQKSLKAVVHVSTEDKSVTIDATLSSWELKPFVRFRLMSIGFEEQLLKIKFTVNFKVSIKNLGVRIGETSDISAGTLMVDLSSSLKEVETPLGTQPINLQFGNNKFEIKLPTL